MLHDFLKAIRQIYFKRNIVLWLIIIIIPTATSVFMVQFFSARTIQHIPIGILKQDYSPLANQLELALRSDPVLNVSAICSTLDECEHALIRGDLQAFIIFPYAMERHVRRLESPIVPVFSSGQNYLTNSFAVKEIRSVFATIGAGLFTMQHKEPMRVQLKSIGNERGNYQGFLGIGLVTAIFHLAGILGAVYLFCFPFRDNKVQEFLKAAGNSRFVLWAATLLPIMCIQWGALFVIYVYTRSFVSPLTNDEFWMVAVSQFVTLFACNGIGAALAGITGNMRIASSAAGVLAGPAFAFAGQTFPIMGMPLAIRMFSFFLPLTHILKAQSCMLLGASGKAACLESIYILIGMAIFWHLLGALFLFNRWKSASQKETAEVADYV